MQSDRRACFSSPSEALIVVGYPLRGRAIANMKEIYSRSMAAGDDAMSRRILIAGFQHETNTFAPTKADYSSFQRGEMYPAMVRGRDVLELEKVNIPIGGFIQE